MELQAVRELPEEKVHNTEELLIEAVHKHFITP
jgi:hypothetical protein